MNREERKAKGICVDCHEPAAINRIRCEKHLIGNKNGVTRYLSTDKGLANLEKRSDSIKESQIKFRKKQRRSLDGGRYNYVKHHCIKKGKKFSLTKDEYHSLILEPCFYCGLSNDVEAGVGLDRLDNMYGYHLWNVKSCCKLCNMTRGNRFSIEEMKIIGQCIREIRIKRTQNEQ